MRRILTFIGCLLLYSITQAQTTVSGIVTDKTENKPIFKAVVSLLHPKDTMLLKFTRTDSLGKFKFSDVKEGEYILMVSQPRYGDLMDNISVQKENPELSIGLLNKATLLQEIIVKSGSPLRIKGDTTIYTADSFKVSANANVEELLKKLPGIQVDKDGKITAMGQTVQKVLVDGEEFFGEDPGMAVKNLRADAVKEVQVFDKKSDQAEFTGIDDGQTQKTINLKLKEDSKHGYFGKIDVAAGPQKHIENRYNDNLMFSSFKSKRKFSAYFLNGNTGKDRLNWDDMQKYGGSDFNMPMGDDGESMMSYGGNNDGEPYIDTRNGFMTNTNAGLQYSNKWSDKYNFNLSPQYNNQQYTNRTRTLNQTQIGDSVLNQNSTADNAVSRYNIKIRGKWDLQLDSMNSLKITANGNFYHTESDAHNQSATTGNNETLKNISESDQSTTNDKSAFTGNIIYQHKFKKARRTLAFNANWSILNSKGLSFLKSENQSFFEGKPAGNRSLNQKSNGNQHTNNSGLSVTYTEPLTQKFSLELGYRLGLNDGKNTQTTHAYSDATGKYDELIDSLSNDFRQRIVQNIPSAKINFANKKLKVNFGAGFGFTSFNLRDITMGKSYDRSYVNFYPNANLTYTYKPNHSIHISYNGNTTQPTINQLQPLRNNNDYFNQYIGNEHLKPSFTNNFNIGHDSYNFLKDIFSYFGGGVNFTNNSITNNQIINVDSGKTITQPINVNGNISGYFYGGFGLKIKSINTNFNLNPNINFNKYVGMLNNMKNISRTFSPSLSAQLYKDKENKYSVSLEDEFSYNSTSTSQNKTKIQYYTNEISFNGTIYLQKVWSLSTDYSYEFRQKAQPSDRNLITQLWNAKFQRTFRNNEFTTYFSVNDILNQNIGINRSFYGTSYSEVRNDRLKRYFLLGFIWNFKNKGPASK